MAADTQSYAERSVLELSLAHMETRLQERIVELLEPTIQRTSMVVKDVEEVTIRMDNNARTTQELQMLHIQATEQVATILSFKEELGRWDTQRRAHESFLNDRQEAMQQKLDAFQYSLEQKESALHHLHRSVERAAAELNHVAEDFEIQKVSNETRLDETSRKVNQVRSELEARLMGLEIKHNALTDEVWGEETGLAKVVGELRKTNVAFANLQEVVSALKVEKAEAEALERLRGDVARMVSEANSSVAAMRQSVGNVVNDVREHFRTASQAIAAHNATFISRVRSQYQEELENAARLRDEVQGFIAQTGKDIVGLDGRVAEAAAKAGSLVAEAREELEELNRRRKRDKTSSDNELKALKKRLGGVFDNSDMVVRGIEHIYGVLQSLLQGELMQCSLERQDAVDRKRIALMGVKDDESVLARSCQTEPQRARPECRGKAAIAYPGSKVQGVLRGRSGDKAMRLQEPVVRVDNRCVSCSGQAPLVLSAFKMACLQYTPSAVEHDGAQHERDDLLQQRHHLLQNAHASLLHGPDSLRTSSKGLGLQDGDGDEASSREVAAKEDSPKRRSDAFSEYAAVEARLQARGGDSANNTFRLPYLSASAVAGPGRLALTAR